MGPGRERFAEGELLTAPRDFVQAELAKRPAKRFQAVCFDARRLPLPDVVKWLRGLDRAQDELDYYVRRVVVLKSARSFKTGVPEEMRERPDITWIATSDPSDAPTIYRRHLTEMFQDVLGVFKKKKTRG